MPVSLILFLTQLRHTRYIEGWTFVYTVPAFNYPLDQTMLQRLSADPQTAAVVAWSLMADCTTFLTVCSACVFVLFCRVAVVIVLTFARRMTKSKPVEKSIFLNILQGQVWHKIPSVLATLLHTHQHFRNNESSPR